MASIPLFIADEDTLKKQVRLSDLPDDSVDAQAIFDRAVLNARLEFYKRLGSARVTAILTYSSSSTPTTDNEVVRALAEIVEHQLVWCDLMRYLPAAFMDASGDLDDRFNEEAPFREVAAGDSDVLSRCREEIEANMQFLEGEKDPGEDCDIRVFDGTPTTTPPRPGDTLLCVLNRYRFTDPTS